MKYSLARMETLKEAKKIKEKGRWRGGGRVVFEHDRQLDG